MRGIIRHPVSGIFDADPHGAIRGHAELALRRREQRDMKNKKSNVANFLEVQWVRGKTYSERQPRNTVEEGAERLRSSTDRDPEGRQRRDVLRTMRDVWEVGGSAIPLAAVARDPEVIPNNRTALASAGKRLVEIERPFVSAWKQEHDDAGHTAAESLLGMLDVQDNTNSGLSMDGCDVRLVDRRSFEGVDANVVPVGEDENTVLLKSSGAAERRRPGGMSPVDL